MRAWAPLLVAALVAVLSWLGAHRLGDGLRKGRAALPKVEERAFVPDPRAARFVSLGYNELAADLWWSRTLLYYGDGMIKGFAMPDVEALLELINAFDPWFRRPYIWGGYATTFRQRVATQAEYRASIAVLERGLEVFPDDYEINWLLGLRYYLDLKSDDPVEQRRFQEMGADYISRSVRLPGSPAERGTLAARLHTKLGQRERALRELKELILTTPDPKAREKLIARYQELADQDRAELIKRAAEDIETAWKATLPYAPSSLFVQVGARPPQRRLRDLFQDDLGVHEVGEDEDVDDEDDDEPATDEPVESPGPGAPGAPSPPAAP